MAEKKSKARPKITLRPRPEAGAGDVTPPPDMRRWVEEDARKRAQEQKMMDSEAIDSLYTPPAEPFKKGGAVKNPFAGKESRAEEAKERKRFPGAKAYKAAEAKFEGEGRPFASGGTVRGAGCATRGVKKCKMC